MNDPEEVHGSFELFQKIHRRTLWKLKLVTLFFGVGMTMKVNTSGNLYEFLFDQIFTVTFIIIYNVFWLAHNLLNRYNQIYGNLKNHELIIQSYGPEGSGNWFN